MFYGLNKVVIVGIIATDPMCKITAKGIPVANISIATTDVRTDTSTGKVIKNTELHKVVLWESLAEKVRKHLCKGSIVCVEGKLNTSVQYDNTGSVSNCTKIVADDIKIIGVNDQYLKHQRSNYMNFQSGYNSQPMSYHKDIGFNPINMGGNAIDMSLSNIEVNDKDKEEIKLTPKEKNTILDEIPF